MDRYSPPVPELAASPFRDVWDWVIVCAIFTGIALLGYVAVRSSLFAHWGELARQGEWSALFLRPTILWISMGMLLLVFRTSLWLRYRSFPAASPADAPPLTIIIPAYNEGRMVAKSIDS